MNVILIQDVDKLGTAGTEVKVKDGYARNFLIPQKLAMAATPAALNFLERKRKERERLEQQHRTECEQMSEKMKDISLTISMEAGEEDKLFGAVTSEMVAENLAQEGVEIDRKQIILEEPIKRLGVYNVDIKLHPEVKTQVRVWVVKK